ncbi:hypothetical protein AB0H83_49950 [Dactylosporangium sp. NPDC050688]|uniref:hypothetical protein n=1 Tax=Dactylosporangium sp. NPDC050688 TaxID=3157217 RepID=UPI0033D3FFCD
MLMPAVAPPRSGGCAGQLLENGPAGLLFRKTVMHLPVEESAQEIYVDALDAALCLPIHQGAELGIWRHCAVFWKCPPLLLLHIFDWSETVAVSGANVPPTVR